MTCHGFQNIDVGVSVTYYLFFVDSNCAILMLYIVLIDDYIAISIYL
jgi:hypothetical protein